MKHHSAYPGLPIPISWLMRVVFRFPFSENESRSMTSVFRGLCGRVMHAVRLFTLLLCLASVARGIPAVAAADTALLSYWQAEGTADDTQGAHHGMLINGTGFVAGKTGQAFAFDGVDDAVDVGTFEISGEELTIAGWINADDFGVHDGRILSKATSSESQDHDWMVSTDDSNGIKLRFRVRTNGSTSTLVASSGTLVPGVWTHIAAVYDGSAMRLYKDGVEVGSAPKTGAIDVTLWATRWVAWRRQLPSGEFGNSVCKLLRVLSKPSVNIPFGL